MCVVRFKVRQMNCVCCEVFKESHRSWFSVRFKVRQRNCVCCEVFKVNQMYDVCCEV